MAPAIIMWSISMVQPQDADNYKLWCSRDLCWPLLSRNQKKNYKKRYKNMLNDYLVMKPSAFTYSEPKAAACGPEITASEITRREKNMNAIYAQATNTINHVSDEQKQREYLIGRLDEIFRTKNSDLEVVFGMKEVRPRTVNELIEFISKGKYELRDGYLDTPDWYSMDSFLCYFDWKDPSIKNDPEGYKAARKVMDLARTETQDCIKIKSPEAGLDAMQAFEKRTFH